MNKPVFSIIIPAYNEGKSLRSVLDDLTRTFVDRAEIIVVSDGSTDDTAGIAKSFSMVRCFEHNRNRGYGASIKTGIRQANANLLCLFDADGQHHSTQVARLLDEYHGEDMVVGSRGAGAFKNLYRAPGKLILQLVANFLAGVHIPDLNSGLRLIRRDVILRYVHLLPDGFSASTTTTMVFLTRKYDVKYVPVITRQRRGKSQVRYLRDGINTIILILRIIMLFNPMKFFLTFSAFFVSAGLSYGIYKLFTNHQAGFPVGALLVVSTGVLSFVFGLLADQISQLRMERFEVKDYLKKEQEG